LVASDPGSCARLPQTGCIAAVVSSSSSAGRLFACRYCYRLAYRSQQESIHQRGLWKSQQIRMRLGGSASMLDEFPDTLVGHRRLRAERSTSAFCSIWRRTGSSMGERCSSGFGGRARRAT
jgi:hypothetical protein